MDTLEKQLNYKFKNHKFLNQALTHKSCNTTKNNERLEFLGDAVVDLLIGEYIYKKFENANEGDLSKIRAAMVNEDTLSNLAKSIGLDRLIKLSRGELKDRGMEKPSILANTFEAIFGVIYLESGIIAAKTILIDLIEKHYKNIDLFTISKDYKTALQEVTQERFGEMPIYKEIGSHGPDHLKSFEMAVLIKDREMARAVGKSKKIAQQNCAKILFYKLKGESNV